MEDQNQPTGDHLVTEIASLTIDTRDKLIDIQQVVVVEVEIRIVIVQIIQAVEEVSDFEFSYTVLSTLNKLCMTDKNGTFIVLCAHFRW